MPLAKTEPLATYGEGKRKSCRVVRGNAAFRFHPAYSTSLRSETLSEPAPDLIRGAVDGVFRDRAHRKRTFLYCEDATTERNAADAWPDSVAVAGMVNISRVSHPQLVADHRVGVHKELDDGLWRGHLKAVPQLVGLNAAQSGAVRADQYGAAPIKKGRQQLIKI